MLFNLKVFLLALLSTDVVFCELKEDNSTVISTREIIEQQARTAYQNACYRMQELSNWMTAVFRIKSVWASATVNEIASRSEGITDSDRRNKHGLPSRPKTAASECSLSNVQVTAQTYAYLQSQLVMMKWLLGRNIFKSSKEMLGGAKERMKMLETFNTTLNGVVSQLMQSTIYTSTSLDSEVLKARNIKDVPTETGMFFQNLGRNLDKLIFSVSTLKQNTGNEDSDEHSVTSVESESPVAKDENYISEDENSVSKNENYISEDENSVSKNENYISKDENSVSKDENSVSSVHNPFTENGRFANKGEHSVAKVSTNNAIMYSSIF